ncbi:MAG TPA: hypothetical protein VGC59_10235 [Solirubrobacteraceae bacterium]|jgi:hypothetical protein
MATEDDPAAARNETYKHLEDPLRLSGLTVGQYAAMAGTTLVAIVFGLYISPLPTGVTMGLSLFLAGLPIAVSYAVSGFDVSVTDTIAALCRWAREDKHFLPGAGETPTGYVVAQVSSDQRPPSRSPEDVASARRQLEGAWDA